MSTINKALQTLCNAAEKKVIVTIDENDFDLLKSSNYRLCFAKKVGDFDYNVVWQSYKDYAVNNEFSWLPLYQLFCTDTFKASIKVVSNTQVRSIGLGETCVLNDKKSLGVSYTAGDETALNMINNFGPTHPAVSQFTVTADGTHISTPIYVAISPSVSGEVSLTPKEKVLIWFQQDIETSTMFSSVRSKSIEVDLSTENMATIQYSAGRWLKI